MKIGILALQGDVEDHIRSLKKASDNIGVNSEIVEVKKNIECLDGLVIPGGESTTLRKLLDTDEINLRDMPLMGTCAGCILMSELMPIKIVRNGYGGQKKSFETSLNIRNIGVFKGVFIRAPRITEARCEVLAELRGEPVMVESDRRIALTFHPELTGDVRVHEYFLKKILD